MKPFRPLAAVALALVCLAAAQEEGGEFPDVLAGLETGKNLPPLFPFRIVPGLPDNITNVQTWDGPWQPAGSQGFVRTGNARFADDQGPRYFTGTNICFTGCFPEHDQAELVAADLARFGFNLVRLHYVHHQFPPNKTYASPDSFIEPVQLDKFDYLFHQLKQRGIHVYMQLNIARKFGKESGFENADQLPWYNNGIDNIEPRMIALQKKYVRDLLGHVNPYTGLAYKDEPAIAMFELANENSVVVNWYQGKLDNLPSPYAEQFQELWNAWLREKYATTAALRAAWKCVTVPDGDEMIPDGHFPLVPANEANYPAWGLQHDGTSQGEWAILPGEQPPVAGKNITRLTIRKIGATPNMPQFFRRFGVEHGVPYNLTFKLRASRASQVSARVSQDHDPWQVCGFRTTFAATEDWQDYAFSFCASMTDPRVRLVFANFAEDVTVELADLSLRPGGTIGLAENETLEAGTVPLPKGSGPARYHIPEILADMSGFLFDAESRYFQQMYHVAKQELNLTQGVTGTQLGYGFHYPQGRTDFCDIHSYWCHPSAPGGGIWTNPKQRQLWFVRNLPMVDAEPGRSTLSRLAIARVTNRPYTVSEYDHPYPNLYAAEGNPMLFALGAFQNWNGIMHFAWTHSSDFRPETMSGYFDMKANPVKQAHFPACHAMFTRGDVTRGPGRFRYTLDLSEKQEREISAAKAQPSTYLPTQNLLNPDRALPLVVFSGLNLTDLDAPAAGGEAKPISSWNELPESMGSPEKKWIRNEFGELHWNFDAAAGGYFQVDTPNTKVFTGFVRNRSFEFGGLTLTPGQTRLDWTTFSLVKAKGAPGLKDRLTPGHYLLAATGLMHNTGTVLKQALSDAVSTAPGYAGVPGTAPILCEGIPATLTLQADAAKTKLFALDPNGDRAREVPVTGTATAARIEIGPQYQTIWYELVIE